MVKKRAKSKKVPSMPPGFRTVTPYLSVAGAAKAIDFYKKAFGAKEVMRNLGPDGSVMHARLRIGDSLVMLSDMHDPVGAKPKASSPIITTLHVYTKDVDRMWRNAIAAGAKVDMPLDDTFWGERYGQVIDPFGHRWSLSMQISMTKEEKEAKREAAMAMFAKDEDPGRES